MKAIRFPKLSHLVLIAAACLTLSACAGIPASITRQFSQPVVKPVVVDVPATNVSAPVISSNLVPEVSTQIVAGQPVVVTNEVIRYITNFQAVLVPAHTETQYVTMGYETPESLTNRVQFAQGVNSAVNPTPSAPIINWGLSLVLAAAGLFNHIRTSRINADKSTVIDNLKKVVNTAVAGIESYPSASTKDLKTHIQEVAVLQGTQPLLKEELVARGLSNA